MRIKDVRQGLHKLLHTEGLDGLLHLYKRLEKRGRALLLCLLCAEAGWLILVNARLRLERAYLKLRLFFCASVIGNSQKQKWDNSLYCFNFFDPTGSRRASLPDRYGGLRGTFRGLRGLVCRNRPPPAAS